MKEHEFFESHRRGFTALVEIERNQQDSEGGWVTFDCFSVTPTWQRHRHREEFDLLALRVSFASVAQLFPAIGESEGRWVKIEVTSQATTRESISAEVVMFGDNAETVTLHIAHVSSVNLNSRENELFRLIGARRSPASLIAGVLDFSLSAAKGLAIAAYDVGQGNCNAIVDEYEHPRVFFDLGWAPNFHRHTRPLLQPDFFSCDSLTTAPVVLSHWDMDHWAYAIARSEYDPANLTTRHVWNVGALNRFWIARAPETEHHHIGPLAQSFYKALEKVRLLPGLPAILLWPEKCQRIRFSDGWLEACEPAPSLARDRNNTGIAMFVRPKGRGPAILMTGDADFPSIPSLKSNTRLQLAGMVAPHHGSRITAGDVPKPMAGSPKTLVISVGHGNTYGHPKQDSIDAYEAAGWNGTVVLTRDRQVCDRTCLPIHEHNHGNILLKFSTRTKDPRCGCGMVSEGNLCLVPSSVPIVAPVPGIKKVRRRKTKAVVT